MLIPYVPILKSKTTCGNMQGAKQGELGCLPKPAVSSFVTLGVRAEPDSQVVNPRVLLNRESESFGSKFLGPSPTPIVGSGPYFVNLEPETFGHAKESAQTLARKAINAKRPATDLSASGVNWLGGQFRAKLTSSPEPTLFETSLSLAKAASR